MICFNTSFDSAHVCVPKHTHTSQFFHLLPFSYPPFSFTTAHFRSTPFPPVHTSVLQFAAYVGDRLRSSSVHSRAPLIRWFKWELEQYRKNITSSLNQSSREEETHLQLPPTATHYRRIFLNKCDAGQAYFAAGIPCLCWTRWMLLLSHSPTPLLKIARNSL